MATLNRSILEAALIGLEEQRKRLDDNIAEIRSMLGSRGPERQTSAAATPAAQPPRKGRMSAAARKRISDAQRKRWASARAAKN